MRTRPNGKEEITIRYLLLGFCYLSGFILAGPWVPLLRVRSASSGPHHLRKVPLLILKLRFRGIKPSTHGYETSKRGVRARILNSGLSYSKSYSKSYSQALSNSGFPGVTTHRSRNRYIS